MEKFTKESIELALQKINSDPTIVKGRESKDYDLLTDDGRTYPPLLVLSEAHQILGGGRLVVNDFNNAVARPFRILKQLGYNIVRKNFAKPTEYEEFDYKKFVESCKSVNLVFTEQLALRFTGGYSENGKAENGKPVTENPETGSRRGKPKRESRVI